MDSSRLVSHNPDHHLLLITNDPPAIFCNVFLSGFDGTITASTYAVIGSDFNAANTVSWITTSYLITTTAFQPLYGRFSDVLGRRVCFFTATIAFSLGCLGCGLAPNIIFLNLMRGLTGLGGGGLVTMATIINSDIIPLQNRGMYQASQNGLLGFGAICGASLGGVIADSVGWRWCFLCQVPVSMAGLIVGHFVIKNPAPSMTAVRTGESGQMSLWRRIDFSGAILLVLGLSSQLTALSLGGNQYPWSDTRVIVSFAISVVILIVFVWVELKTEALPVLPMSMLRGRVVISNTVSNVLCGMSAFAFLFTIPLFFQVVLSESASKAGIRLIIPSLGTPVGGLIAGFTMSRWGMLNHLVRLGCLLMVIGNGVMATLNYHDSSWKYIVYLFPANLGQGIVFPSMLFTNIAAFQQSQQAVSTSTVYLFRSMGSVWGVAAASTIIQNVLSSRLPGALSGIPDKLKIITSIRHSITALSSLDPEVQEIAHRVHFEALQLVFLASTAWALIALVAAFFARGQRLDRR
ncbi:MFS general substrate transporter [Hyaloscypha bicolor E]|uniref:MFS general substrate transporter n=1 Tax=Hyaloscypha bicolor E TaxID=1095630 RepID=A0A2J6T432_9HELO|nr:MFS general substrate transporter [Hyaloscypha bicolor E]PMD57777.1 MFS general substrate transporter [Hyaloscypha bicolor E]